MGTGHQPTVCRYVYTHSHTYGIYFLKELDYHRFTPRPAIALTWGWARERGGWG